jgi:NAD(P)-dependent dehydrogenase (short-subunit alcohol dehydrogenase family)
MKTLRDRVAVVTGGASGIGLATAKRFASEGAKLVLADIEQKALDPACEALRGEGADVLGVVCDVSDPKSVDALAKAALDHFGGIHVVMNNAGVGTAGALWERPLSEIEWVVNVNLWGVIHGIRACRPILPEQNEPAHVVNIASMAGLTSAPYLDIYTATKHAVVALSETLYKEMRSLDTEIGVTVVCPGLIKTNLMTGDRNRPGAQDPETPEFSAGGRFMFEILEKGTAGGWDPSVVGDAITDAIHEDRFYVIPAQEEVAAAIDVRLEDLRTRRNPWLPGSE